MQLSVSIESIEDGETEQLMKPVLFEACTDYIDQVRSVAEEDRFFSIDSLTNMGISYYNEANRISFSLTYEEPYYGVRIKPKTIGIICMGLLQEQRMDVAGLYGIMRKYMRIPRHG